MSRKTSENEYRRSQWLIAAVYLTLVGVLAMATASADDGLRRSNSQHLPGGSDSESSTVTVDDYAPLATAGPRSRTRDRQAPLAGDSGPRIAAATRNDFWIYAADVILFGDDDNDGYQYGIDLEFDADTVFSSAVVYAALFLSLDGGPWNEYAVTDDFLIEGARAGDAYTVVTELQSGYPSGNYDLLIELYDADTGEFLTDLGPEASTALSILPLEDFNRDAPTFDNRITVSRESGGGTTGWWLLAMLSSVVLMRWKRRPTFPAVRAGVQSTRQR